MKLPKQRILLFFYDVLIFEESVVVLAFIGFYVVPGRFIDRNFCQFLLFVLHNLLFYKEPEISAYANSFPLASISVSEIALVSWWFDYVEWINDYKSDKLNVVCVY